MIDPFLVEILDKQDVLGEQIKIIAASHLDIVTVLNAVIRKLELDYEQIKKQVAEANRPSQDSEGERLRSEDTGTLLSDSGQLDSGVPDPEDDRDAARDFIDEEARSSSQTESGD